MSLERKKLLQAVPKLRDMLQSSNSFMPAYGDRYRKEEIITTSFVASAVKQS